MEIELKDFINPQYGEQYPVRVDYQWATDVVSKGRTSQRNQIWSQPRRHWFINYEALTKTGRDKFLEMFHRAAGRYRTFLLRDVDDFLCSGEAITTDGTTATYQLCKTYYPGESESWTENKKNIMPSGIFAPVVTHSVDGAQTEVAAAPGANEFTLSDTTGIMTWSGGNEPSVGTLTVTFQFYFRVRFDFDRHSDIKYLPDYWRAEGIHLIEDE
jgi:uncharacterized protein (TIGR02217 family)